MSSKAAERQTGGTKGQDSPDEAPEGAERPNVQADAREEVELIFKPRLGEPVARIVSKSFDHNVSRITTTEVESLGFPTVDKDGRTIKWIDLELKVDESSTFFFETFKVVAPEEVPSGPSIALDYDGFMELWDNQYPARLGLLKKGKKNATEKEQAESKARHDQEIEKENAQFLAMYLKQQKTPPKPRGRL